jgi:sucrose-6-phosphate hydrolase SacC (GH32 family)
MSQSSSDSYNEVYRPQFHFSAETNWLNDPNGLVYYKGTYHMFFQHNPSGIDWGNMTWGHATSPDLVHWTQGLNAISPDSLGTIFSGSAVVDWNNTSGFQSGSEKPLVAIYACAGDTSPESKGQPYTQCLAYSQDAGKTWQKYSGNPVIHQIKPGNRDPKVVWYDPKREWVMALYLDNHDYALLTSPDLKTWKEIQRFADPGTSECPDYFEIPVVGSSQKKWVFVSASGQYLVGSFDGDKFTAEQNPLRMDLGPNYYAVQTYSDIPRNDGRRIQIAWMNGGKYPGMPFNQQMSFPCVLTLGKTPDGFRIYRNPVKEIRSLYNGEQKWTNVNLAEGDSPLSKLSGDLWDLDANIEVGSAKKVELKFRGTSVSYDVAKQTLSAAGKTEQFRLRNGRLKFRALIDRSSFELFGNDGEFSFTACFLPNVDDHSLSLVATGGAATIRSLTVHSLKSAWPKP